MALIFLGSWQELSVACIETNDSCWWNPMIWFFFSLFCWNSWECEITEVLNCSHFLNNLISSDIPALLKDERLKKSQVKADIIHTSSPQTMGFRDFLWFGCCLTSWVEKCQQRINSNCTRKCWKCVVSIPEWLAFIMKW